jgi:hypothetical protein
MATTPTASEREQLLREILASRQFAHADNLKRILRFLAERAKEPGATPPKEYEIALGALGRPATFDPRTDPIIRVSVGGIRDRLFAYFATEGRESPWRIEVPKGQYALSFLPNAPALQQEELSQRPTYRFWQPYLEAQVPNVIVYTEPLFFRAGPSRYFRDWSVNTLGDGADRIRQSYTFPDACEVEPVFHYLSAGEMHCLLSLTRMFWEAGVPVETRNCRNSHWTELSGCNLILLGSPRTNSFLRQMQGDTPMIVFEEHIELTESPNETRSLRGRRFRHGSLHRLTEYAVVTRRPGVLPGCTVTLIAANHGRAIEGTAHRLTLDDHVGDLLHQLGAYGTDPLPHSFQALFRVECVDIDDEVTAVAMERCLHIPDPPGAEVNR